MIYDKPRILNKGMSQITSYEIPEVNIITWMNQRPRLITPPPFSKDTNVVEKRVNRAKFGPISELKLNTGVPMEYKDLVGNRLELALKLQGTKSANLYKEAMVRLNLGGFLQGNVMGTLKSNLTPENMATSAVKLSTLWFPPVFNAAAKLMEPPKPKQEKIKLPKPPEIPETPQVNKSRQDAYKLINPEKQAFMGNVADTAASLVSNAFNSKPVQAVNLWAHTKNTAKNLMRPNGDGTHSANYETHGPMIPFIGKHLGMKVNFGNWEDAPGKLKNMPKYIDKMKNMYNTKLSEGTRNNLGKLSKGMDTAANIVGTAAVPAVIGLQGYHMYKQIQADKEQERLYKEHVNQTRQ